MRGKRKSFASGMLAVLVAISVVLSAITPAFFSVLAETDIQGAVESLVSGGAVDQNTVIFENMALDWCEKDDTAGKPVAGWYVGIRVNAPAEFNPEQLQTSCYKNPLNTQLLFWETKNSSNEDQNHYVDFWISVTEEDLNNALVNQEVLAYPYTFDWDADGVFEQTVSAVVTPNGLLLKKDSVVRYPSAGEDKGFVEAVTGGATIADNRSNIVTVAYNQTTQLTYISEQQGYPSAGWWVNLQVNAPSSLKEEKDFTNVMYQVDNNGVWSNSKSVWENKITKDTDTAHSMQLLTPVTKERLAQAKKAGEQLEYQWRFDWDGNGIFEQMVRLVIDPAKVILLDENGAQVFPYWGTVLPLTSGSVTQEGSAVNYVIDQVSLEWSPANQEIGRTVDGWWVGMKVTAPQSVTAEELKNAFYNRRMSFSGQPDWTDATKVSFWSAKDTADNAAVHTIEMWMVLTPATLKTYENAQKNIATEYAFDWNGDQEIDQVITMAVVPSDKIVLNKVEQNGFGFQIANPDDQLVKNPFTNVAVGGQGTGTVTYEIVEGNDVATVDQNGRVSFIKEGIVTVRATKAADDVYQEISAQYTVRAIRANQIDFAFENSNQEIQTQFNQTSFTNTAVGGQGTGKVVYSLVSGQEFATIDAETGKVTFFSAGTVTVRATKEADAQYNSIYAEYTLVIEKSYRPALQTDKESKTITYATQPQTVFNITGGVGNQYTYRVVEGDVATVDATTGALTTQKAGGSVVVEITQEEDGGYYAATPIRVTVYVEYALQQNFAFAKTTDTVVYNSKNNTYNNAVAGGSGKGAVTYEILEGTDVANINTATGELTICSAGTVKVQATKAGDDCYQQTTAEYTLEIQQAKPDFSVKDCQVTYGAKQFAIPLTGTLAQSGTYTYSIVGENVLNATMGQNGILVFDTATPRVGTITVSVKRAEDACYVALEKTLKVIVSYLEPTASPVVSGEKKNESGWYTGAVQIAAPAGYQISFTNTLSTIDWDDDLTLEAEDNVGAKTVYLKNEKGITDGIAVEGLLIDKTNPSNLSISYTARAWERVLEAVTFGYYSPTQVEITLTASDSGSGIAKFLCSYEGKEIPASQMTFDGDTASYTFTVTDDFKGSIGFSAIDVAGRETELTDNQVLVVDTKRPELSVSYEAQGGALNDESSVLYSNTNLTAYFQIQEENFLLSMVEEGDAPVFTVNGNQETLIWEFDENTKTASASYTFSADGSYTLALTYTDLSQNGDISYEKTVCVDTTDPAMGIGVTGTPVKDNIYNTPLLLSFLLEETNFKASKASVSVSAVDIQGNPIDLSSKAYQEFVKNPENWVADDNNGHTLHLLFDIDGSYTLVFEYADLAGNPLDRYVTEFVIDQTPAKNIQISYSKPLITKVLEGITFGFYQGDVKVTVTAEDDITGVDFFQLTYIANSGENTTNRETFTTDPIEASSDKNMKNKFTASYTLPHEARGSLSALAIDHATNNSQGKNDEVVVLDTQIPGLDVDYTFTNNQMREYNGVYHTQGKTSVVFTIDEANFDLSLLNAIDETKAPAAVITVNNGEQEVTWNKTEGTNLWVSSPVELTGDGDYVVAISFTDRAGNQMDSYSQEIHIDTASPECGLKIQENPVKDSIYNKATAEIQLKEHNFKPSEVVATVSAVDIQGNPVDLSAKGYAEYVKNPENWESQGDVHTLKAIFDIDGIYTVMLEYNDLANNAMQCYVSEFVVDNTPAQNLQVEYSKPLLTKVLEGLTFGFYKGETTVTVTAQDDITGVDFFDLTYHAVSGENTTNKESFTQKLSAVQDQTNKNQFTATYVLSSDDARGDFSVVVADHAKNISNSENKDVVVLDTKIPGLTVDYTFASNQMREYKDIYYTQGKTSVVFTIDEANFDLSLLTATDETKAPAPVITVNNGEQEVTWNKTEGTNLWASSPVELTGDGDYVVAISFADRAGNQMESYSQEIHIDHIAPAFGIGLTGEPVKENIYNPSTMATIVMEEHNVNLEEVNLWVEAVDINGNAINISAKDYTEYAKNPENWSSNGDEHILTLPAFDIEARYTLHIDYTDLAENQATHTQMEFMVDKTPAQNVQVKYSQSLVEKLLGALTFGFYQGNTTVTVTAEDTVAGVDYFELSYHAESGENTTNKEDFTTKLTAVQDQTNKHQFIATYELEPQARGNFSVVAFDHAGNNSKGENEIVAVLDTKIPGLDVDYTFTNNQMREYSGIYYTQGDTLVTYTIDEANFDLSLLKDKDETDAPAPLITVNGKAQTVTWEKTEGTNLWVGTPVELKGDGDYVVAISFTDRSGNVMDSHSQEIHIDHVAPVFDVTYDNNSALNINNYNANRRATVKVLEHNFNPAEVVLSMNATDVTGGPVDVSQKQYAAYVANPQNWTNNGDVWTLNTDGMLFDIDAKYWLQLEYTDLAENVGEKYTTEFVIDKTKPEKATISYSEHISAWDHILKIITLGYYSYQDDMTVTLTTNDLTAGVDYFTWTYVQEEGSSQTNQKTKETIIHASDIVFTNQGKTATASFVVDAQARGYISATATDRAGNRSDLVEDSNRINIVDNIAPNATVTYQPERIMDADALLDVTATDIGAYQKEDNVVLYYKNAATVTFTVEEANFYADDVDIQVNGKKKAVENWTQNGDIWVGTITIQGDGDYFVTMNYKDRSNNQMVEYRSPKIAIDSTQPTIEVKYDNENATNGSYYGQSRTATITIVEHNFRADDVKAVVTAKDIQGHDILVTDYAAELCKRTGWKSEGDVHVAKVVFNTDAIYTFDLDYADIIGNQANDYPQDQFAVDHEIPTDLKITYSQSVASKIIETLTFGFYQADVQVTLTSDDIISGIDYYFDWTYVRQEGASSVNAEKLTGKIAKDEMEFINDNKTAVAHFTVPSELRGCISAAVIDKAGNIASTTDDRTVIVADTLAPNIQVEYKADNADTLVHFMDETGEKVSFFADAKQVYYNGDVTAKIVVNEANFFEGKQSDQGVIYQVGICVSKTDDDGNTMQYEYLPEGAIQKFPEASPIYFTWNSSSVEDEYYMSIPFNEDGDYTVLIACSDLSSNAAQIKGEDAPQTLEQYTSKPVTVDKTAPVVSVEYLNENCIQTIENRQYFDQEQTAVVSVYEHNFRAKEFAANITALDVNNQPVDVTDYKAFFSDDANWIHEGNVHTIRVPYETDANYTFNFEYQDLAQNKAAEYETDLFTVDKTAPQNLVVSYSKSVMETILETITFGYYKAEALVTIYANDDTSGVFGFTYDCVKTEGTSGVNIEQVSGQVDETTATIQKDGSRFKTEFYVPASLVPNNPQFNGTVAFTAFDRSQNSSDKQDDHRVVVDTIAPQIKVTYNAPVQSTDTTNYYADKVTGQMIITEANFYAKDVQVVVTKDGEAHSVPVTWKDVNQDVHTGDFVLNGDGDYVVRVTYVDRSSNEMKEYVSKRITIDTKAPTVTVTGIRNNSANKVEKYSFTITANDRNMDPATFKPVLRVTLRNSDGSFGSRTVSLGAPQTVENGKTYRYTVDNLKDDGIYALSCSLQDMSGNGYEKVALSDGKEYNTVTFSINRDGSTFAASKETTRLVDQYYVYSVNENVVIEEVNVDPIETYTVKLNGTVLTQGRDYSTSQTNNGNQWCKRTYVINKDLFKNEGEYVITVESVDKTNSNAYSDLENLNVSFVVDQTPPVLTVSGLVSGGRYQVEEQTVTIIPTDDGGRLNSMKVVVLDSNGKPILNGQGEDISVRFDMTGEELLEYLSTNNGIVTVTLPQGYENQVIITCNDCAVQTQGGTNETKQVFEKVTVSPQGFIIFYANKPLFYGSIAGVVVFIGLLIVLVVLKKKKSSNKQ